MPVRKPIIYGRYTIRAMQMREDWEARAYLTGARPGSGDIARARGCCQAEVIDILRDKLDARDRNFRLSRRFDEFMKFAVPSSPEYAEALGLAELNAAHVAMLKAHADAGEQGLSATELAYAGGYADFSTANLHYGIAGRRLGDALGVELPRSGSRDADLPTGVIAAWLPTPDAQDGSVGRWVMYPELRKAVMETLL